MIVAVGRTGRSAGRRSQSHENTGQHAMATHPSGRMSPPSPRKNPARITPRSIRRLPSTSAAAPHTQVHASSISVITVKQFRTKNGCKKQQPRHCRSMPRQKRSPPPRNPADETPDKFLRQNPGPHSHQPRNHHRHHPRCLSPKGAPIPNIAVHPIRAHSESISPRLLHPCRIKVMLDFVIPFEKAVGQERHRGRECDAQHRHQPA